MQLTVKTFNAKQFTVDAEASDSIKTVKVKICAKMDDFPPDEIHLMKFGTSVLM